MRKRFDHSKTSAAGIVKSAVDRGKFVGRRLVDASTLRLNSTRHFHQGFLIL
jgi:hypothetical protein